MPKRGPHPLLKAEFQKLESLIQVKEESKNEEEKGEKEGKFIARVQTKIEIQKGGSHTHVTHTK